MIGDMGLNFYIKDVVIRLEYQHKRIGRPSQRQEMLLKQCQRKLELERGKFDESMAHYERCWLWRAFTI